jgi:3-oxoadipate enol-lactonase
LPAGFVFGGQAGRNARSTQALKLGTSCGAATRRICDLIGSMERILPQRVKSGDAEIVYWVLGDGPPVFLLHPFPVNHEFWLPVAEVLATRYRVVLPDLRGHGDSAVGEGPATMEKHAADIAHVMDDASVGRAPLVGVSIGGYALFEFWRKHRGRVAALGLFNTKAAADGSEARAGRLQAANEVLDRGTEPFFESMIPRVLAKTTREMRPDLADGALRMMRKMSPEDVAQVQRGMAARPDSVETLKTINVPTLLVTGDDDVTTGVNEAEVMRQHIRGSQLRVVAKAGHYAAWEQPEEVTRLLRQFLDAL